MTSRVALGVLGIFVCLVIIAVLVPTQATAQEVTYYSFDSATFDRACDDPEPGPGKLCFNNGLGGSGTLPVLVNEQNDASNVEDCFPDGSGGRCPYANGSGSAIQMTTASGQKAAVWFSVPQKVKDGFTAYFAFRLGSPSSFPKADGVAFTIQNASGATGGSGSGPNVIGVNGGGIGYMGILNSLAVEFDDFINPWDPEASGDAFQANHIAVQSCGTAANGPAHVNGAGATNCLVSPGALQTILPSELSDGLIHEAVIEYSGPGDTNEPTAHALKVYLDPEFVPGTHTPVTGTVPQISIVYDIAASLSLLDGESAYVGLTAATGSLYQTQNILSWTYTPHVPVTQQQPIVDGTPSTFPFGAHTYAATYPDDSTNGTTDMIVTANTISPLAFLALVSNSPFAGSQCQIYEGTGGNCIIYSVHCVTHGTSNKVPCPATEEPTIQVKTAYESDDTTPSTTHGFLRGDPFYAPIDTIQGNGSALTATVHCSGTCSVTNGQTVSVRDNSATALNAENVVVSGSTIDTFTYPIATNTSVSGTGGFVTSNNVQNICNPPGDPTPCWQPQRIDGTTTGRTKNFSELVALTTTGSTPAFTSADHATFTTESAGSFTAVTVGLNFPTITVSGTLPAGVTFTDLGDGTALLAGPPSSGTQGTYPLVFDAQDSVGSHVTQNFTLTVNAATVSVTVNTTPAGRSFTVDGNNYSSSQNFTWDLGSSHDISTTSPQSGGTGTRYVFSSWSDAGAISHSVTASASITYTANFSTQYQLTTAVSPSGGGTVLPASGSFYASGTVVPVSATANSGYAFSNWSGPVASSTAASTSVTMNAPVSVTANFTSTAPQLAASPLSMNFGNVYLGNKATNTLKLTNTGTTSINITNIRFIYGSGGSSRNYGYQTQCGGTLKAGKVCTIDITLKAQDVGPGSSQLVITYTPSSGPVVINLTGNVINPKATASPSSLSFGTIKVNNTSTKTVTLRSTGDTPLTFNGLTIEGSSDFTKSGSCPATMPVNTSCTISVSFKPTAKTTRTAKLRISTNDKNNPLFVSLEGKGN